MSCLSRLLLGRATDSGGRRHVDVFSCQREIHSEEDKQNSKFIWILPDLAQNFAIQKHAFHAMISHDRDHVKGKFFCNLCCAQLSWA